MIAEVLLPNNININIIFWEDVLFMTFSFILKSFKIYFGLVLILFCV